MGWIHKYILQILLILCGGEGRVIFHCDISIMCLIKSSACAKVYRTGCICYCCCARYLYYCQPLVRLPRMGFPPLLMWYPPCCRLGFYYLFFYMIRTDLSKLRKRRLGTSLPGTERTLYYLQYCIYILNWKLSIYDLVMSCTVT